MKRTKLADRTLPPYSRGEEIMNMVTHIAGGALAVAALVLCVVYSALYRDAWAVVSSAVYGGMMIVLYAVSSTYHGLYESKGKKIMQIIDHCTIFFLISATYMPILLIGIRPEHTVLAWVIFGIEWGVSLIAAALNAIDLKAFSRFSMICYIALGWCVIFVLKPTIEAMSLKGFLWLLAGGVFYSVGAVLYALGKKKKYIHSVFHIFVVVGSVLQFAAIFFYIILPR